MISIPASPVCATTPLHMWARQSCAFRNGFPPFDRASLVPFQRRHIPGSRSLLLAVIALAWRFFSYLFVAYEPCCLRSALVLRSVCCVRRRTSLGSQSFVFRGPPRILSARSVLSAFKPCVLRCATASPQALPLRSSNVSPMPVTNCVSTSQHSCISIPQHICAPHLRSTIEPALTIASCFCSGIFLPRSYAQLQGVPVLRNCRPTRKRVGYTFARKSDACHQLRFNPKVHVHATIQLALAFRLMLLFGHLPATVVSPPGCPCTPQLWP
jgi:hypothetical protein